MTWLLTQMWAYLAASGLLALLLGWGLRGALLKRKLRTAEVDAGLAKTELELARQEIEGLYAAQRKLAATVPATAVDTSQLDAQIARLTGDLSTRQAELDALTAQVGDLTRQLDAARAGQPPAVVPSVEPPIDAAAMSNLEWRNRYLESRLRTLEERQSAAPSNPVPATDAGTASGDDVELAKLRWQTDYLKIRLKVFEERAGVQLSGEPPEGPGETETVEPENPPALSKPDTLKPVDPDRETPDEELARLRWRNRYLEGRLAYLEEERSKEPETAPMTRVEVVRFQPDNTPDRPAQAEQAWLSPTLTVPVEAEPEAEPDPEPTFAPVAMVETAQADPVADAETEFVEAGETTGKAAPAALDRPRDGTPDDLTLIEGIGPRIQDVLYSLGVYHFDQIAAWTSANESWVEDYLNFSGRIGHERWVDQARALDSGE